jgi:hypothetical protein
MSQKRRTCTDCDDEFVLTPNHTGRINQCRECGAKNEVPRVQGFTVVESKNSTFVQIRSAEDAAELRRLSRVGSTKTH